MNPSENLTEPSLGDTFRARSIPNTKLRAKVPQKSILELPLFGQTRLANERQQEEAQLEIFDRL